MTHSFDSDWAYSVSGTLLDEIPLMTVATVKPYVISLLLHRGGARPSEVVNCIAPHCSTIDLRVGGWDPIEEDWCEGESTRLEKLVEEVFGEMVSDGTLRYNESLDLWVLTARNLPLIISWVAALGGRIPAHLLAELTKEQRFRLSGSEL